MDPDNAEGYSLTYLDRQVEIPHFHASRRRMAEILTGVLAYLTGSAINEFDKVTINLERFLLVSMVLTQEAQTDAHVWAMRYHNEDNDEELTRTSREVMSMVDMLPAPASEDLRCPVPTTVVSSGRVYWEHFAEPRYRVPSDITLAAGQADMEGYNIVTPPQPNRPKMLRVTTSHSPGVPLFILPCDV